MSKLNLIGIGSLKLKSEGNSQIKKNELFKLGVGKRMNCLNWVYFNVSFSKVKHLSLLFKNRCMKRKSYAISHFQLGFQIAAVSRLLKLFAKS